MSRLPHIVIVGAGFAGMYCVKELQKQLSADEVRITLIDPRNYMTFFPLLVEAGTGSLEPRHVVVPVRKFLSYAKFLLATVTEIDLKNQTVTTRTMLGDENRIEYDHLVIALGAVARQPELPGIREYGYAIKSMADATALRDRAVAMLELADAQPTAARRQNLLSFVVVGGNYTGVEIAAEFNAYLREGARRYPHLSPDDVRVTLVDRNDRILNTLHPQLSDYARKRLEKKGVILRLGRSVGTITLTEAHMDNGEIIPASTVIWAAGIAPHPLVAKTPGLPGDKHGYIPCDPDFRVKGLPNVWGIGDIASNPDPQGVGFPATAQHAVREGVHAAKNIAAFIRNKPLTPLVYETRGMMAPLGHYDGVARIGKLNIAGFLAWFLWRSFYLMKMPGLGLKARVMADWSLGFFFTREYVQLGVHGKHQAIPKVDPPIQIVEPKADAPAEEATPVRV